MIALDTAKGVFGHNVKSNSAGELYFNQEQLGKRQVTNAQEEIEYVSQDTFNERGYKTFGDPVGVLAERAYMENNRVFGDSKKIEELEIIPENELQQKLLSLLNEMGVKTVSLESYGKKYDTSARALADIADKLIAFKDGKITTEDLTEEVSHFIVEATDETELENLLRNVHRTPEWVEFENTYRQIYEQEYSGQELETVLRKEILGKVLARGLQTRFEQQNQPIIARLADIFNRFINKITNYFKPSFQQELNTYKDSIYRSIMSENLFEELNTEQLNGKKYVFYSSAKSQQYKALGQAISTIENQQSVLRRKIASPTAKKSIKETKEAVGKLLDKNKELDKNLEKTVVEQALVGVTESAQSQVNYMSKVIEDNVRKKEHFAQEENSVYQNMVTRLRPALNQLISGLDKNHKMKPRLEKIVKQINELEGKVPANNETALNLIVDRIVSKQNMTLEEEARYRELLRQALETEQKDTNWFHAHLGQLLHAQNIFLNMVGEVIARTYVEARNGYLPYIKKEFLNKLEDAGVDVKTLKNLIGKDGYILNELDQDKVEEQDNIDQASIYNKITGKSIKAEDFNQDLVNDLEADLRTIFDKEWQKVRRERRISFFSEDYEKKWDETFVTISGEKYYKKDVPQEALDFDTQYRAQLREIRINNGGVNTSADEAEIVALHKQRIAASNPRNEDGSLKAGLREVYNEELDSYVIELVKYDMDMDSIEVEREASSIKSTEEEEEANRVYGLQLLNLLTRQFYENNPKEAQALPAKFLNQLNEFETEQEKWDFLRLNANINFPQSFWDGYGANTSLTERLREQGSEEALELIEELRAQQSIISNVLKSNREYNQPSETNATEMTNEEKLVVKDATVRLEVLYQKANSILPETSEEIQEPFAETGVNTAFEQDIEDGQENRLDFILKNVTPNAERQIKKAQVAFAKIQQGELVEDNIFSAEMTVEEAEQALISFAESKVLPYYKRTAPQGYSEIKSRVDSGQEGAVDELINSDLVTISPNFSFYEQNDVINQEWLDNKENKRPQFKKEYLDKVRNEEYYERYGLSSPDSEPTKNLQEWQARDIVLQAMDYSIEKLGLTGTRSRYLPPQFRKTQFRRFEEFTKTANLTEIRQSLTDMVNFREDEEERGQDLNGNPLRSSTQVLDIPMYGVREIEKEDVTDELLHSVAMFVQQASLHESRRRNIGDMLTVQDFILNSDYAGKQAEATNTYKMMKSFLNANFYGVKETFSWKLDIPLVNQQIDVGKIAKVFHRWVRMVNLTGVIVPLTSMFQGSVQTLVENKVGEVVNPIASKLANKEFLRNASSAAAEILGITSKARLNTLGEHFGMYDIVESRLANTNYNKGTRGLLKSVNATHELGNFPITSRIMLSVLMDYRYYNGSVMTYNQFLRRNKGKNKKELNEQWQKLGLLYDDITTTDGIFKYNEEAIESKAENTNLEYLNEALTNRITAAVQDVDTQIPAEQASIAARDARASFLLMHSNWLVLALQRRLKNSHYDLSRDNFTEGSWVTAYNFIKDSVVNRKELKQHWKDTMNDEGKRRNLRRTVIDIAVANALMGMILLLDASMDDDEEPMWGVAFTDYMLTRVANEQISSTLALPNQLAQTAENPIMAADRFYDLFNIGDVFSNEEVSRGTYANYSERYRWLSKNVLGFKDYHRLTNPKKTLDTYKYYNKTAQDYAILSWFFEED